MSSYIRGAGQIQMMGLEEEVISHSGWGDYCRTS
jgi:hypothetical protein